MNGYAFKIMVFACILPFSHLFASSVIFTATTEFKAGCVMCHQENNKSVNTISSSTTQFCQSENHVKLQLKDLNEIAIYTGQTA